MNATVVEEHQMDEGNGLVFCCNAGAVQQGADGYGQCSIPCFNTTVCCRVISDGGIHDVVAFEYSVDERLGACKLPPLVASNKATRFEAVKVKEGGDNANGRLIGGTEEGPDMA